MNDSIYKMTLDIHEQATQAMVNARKYDTARQIDFIITQDGKPFLLKNCVCTLRAVKPDGTVLFASCQTTNNNMTSYHFTNQTCTAVGFVDCELDIFGDNGKRIASPRFIIRVEDTTYSDEIIESENEFSALGEALLAASRVDADVSKSGKVTTLKITNRDGVEKVVEINDGNGIASAVLNADYTLTLTYDDGTSYTTPSIRGAKGEPGNVSDVLVNGESVVSGGVANITTEGGGGVFSFDFIELGQTYQFPSDVSLADVWDAHASGKVVKGSDFLLTDASKSGTGDNAHYYFTFTSVEAERMLGHRWIYILAFNDGESATVKSLNLDTLQPKLIAGTNITIAADGKTISATGGGGTFVTITVSSSGVPSCSHTYSQLLSLIQNNEDFVGVYIDKRKGYDSQYVYQYQNCKSTLSFSLHPGAQQGDNPWIEMFALASFGTDNQKVFFIRYEEGNVLTLGEGYHWLPVLNTAPEGSTPDVGSVYDALTVDNKLADKQDKLTAGDNVTISGNNTISSNQIIDFKIDLDVPAGEFSLLDGKTLLDIINAAYQNKVIRLDYNPSLGMHTFFYLADIDPYAARHCIFTGAQGTSSSFNTLAAVFATGTASQITDGAIYVK